MFNARARLQHVLHDCSRMFGAHATMCKLRLPRSNHIIVAVCPMQQAAGIAKHERCYRSMLWASARAIQVAPQLIALIQLSAAAHVSASQEQME